ncbi:hypothetical protein [Flavobacterium filum]|uniref:hypothetical protein n=1 Tax=Flavobacterium filum TaxID=370974 RepID=UPI0023F0D86C|nr:hypothetical protein [Flavobacterium filum]
MEIENKKVAIENYVSALKELHRLEILKSKHDFTSQIGEWLVETIYNGRRADSSIQKGWDVEVDGRLIQVKTHAKSRDNHNRWTSINKNDTEDINELIIIVFSSDYKLERFYQVPWSIAMSRLETRNKRILRNQLSWSNIEDYRINLDSLPMQNVVSIFR